MQAITLEGKGPLAKTKRVCVCVCDDNVLWKMTCKAFLGQRHFVGIFFSQRR